MLLVIGAPAAHPTIADMVRDRRARRLHSRRRQLALRRGGDPRRDPQSLQSAMGRRTRRRVDRRRLRALVLRRLRADPRRRAQTRRRRAAGRCRSAARARRSDAALLAATVDPADARLHRAILSAAWPPRLPAGAAAEPENDDALARSRDHRAAGERSGAAHADAGSRRHRSVEAVRAGGLHAALLHAALSQPASRAPAALQPALRRAHQRIHHDARGRSGGAPARSAAPPPQCRRQSRRWCAASTP